MRNWYEAISEDLQLDLKELRKNTQANVTPKSLANYKRTGSAPKKEPVINGVLALINTQHPSFTRNTLLDYFAGKYEEAPNDLIKQTCIHNIQKALQLVIDDGVQYESDMPNLPKQANEIAEWVYKTISLPNGMAKVGQLLEISREKSLPLLCMKKSVICMMQLLL